MYIRYVTILLHFRVNGNRKESSFFSGPATKRRWGKGRATKKKLLFEAFFLFVPNLK